MDKFLLWFNTLVVIIFKKIFQMGEKRMEMYANRLRQFAKFGIVGVSNTLISYVVYLILHLIGVQYIIASVMGFVVSVINAFYWNNKFVFKQDETEHRNLALAFFKTAVAYAGTGLILNNILLILWVEMVGIPEMIAPVINLLITIPLNFTLNKYWAFKKGRNKVWKN